MMRYLTLVFISGLVFFVACKSDKETDTKGEKETKRPNFVVIYADDLGYGDIGCFGAKDIETPNLDRMASEGMKFTDFYSASSICSPSRYSLMTGRYPVRDGIHGVFFPESYDGISPEEITVAEALQDNGYATGIFGKWHLGHHHDHLPLQNGFDEYFGIPYSNDMEMVVYMKDNEVVEYQPDQRYTTKTYTEYAVDFIDRHSDDPFFLYVPHSMPHVPIYASEDFKGTSARGLYGDVIQELDWSVGEIMNKLEEKGIAENTLVVFSSDNGPWLVMRDHGGSAGELREGKQYAFEGGMRVPTLAWWKGIIKPGSVEKEMAAMTDWFPTFLSLAGIEAPSHIVDGEDISGVLTGDSERANHEFLYFKGSALTAYRNGDWKLKMPFDGTEPATWRLAVDPHPMLLINLVEDPGESNNLAEKYPERVKQMRARMEELYDNMGELPEGKVIKIQADNSHYEHLRVKYGEDWYKK